LSVLQFSVLQIHALQIGLSFSCPALSINARQISTVLRSSCFVLLSLIAQYTGLPRVCVDVDVILDFRLRHSDESSCRKFDNQLKQRYIRDAFYENQDRINWDVAMTAFSQITKESLVWDSDRSTRRKCTLEYIYTFCENNPQVMQGVNLLVVC